MTSWIGHGRHMLCGPAHARQRPDTIRAIAEVEPRIASHVRGHYCRQPPLDGMAPSCTKARNPARTLVCKLEPPRMPPKLMSVIGTFRTCQPRLTMSVIEGILL